MGLFDKVNTKASVMTVLKRATVSGLVGAAFFFLFKPAAWAAWPVLLPTWVLLCAAVGALAEWQIPDEADEDDDGT
jgi:hypothetical protein